MTPFLIRLKQRKLVQWTLAYLAAGWLVLQVLDLAVDSYHWPGWVMHVLFAALLLGLVVTWLLAWYHGERGEQKVTTIELLLLAGVFAIGGFLIWRFALPHGGPSAAAPTASSPAAVSSAPAVASTAIPAKSIAVLPFENLSQDKNNGYFADGMQDLILTKLADIGDLKVISRTSTMKYASRPDDLRTVGRQLGVAAVLEGSVQKAGDQVLINVQLIDTRTDSHIWANSYQRKLANVFGVEGEVAGKIAEALKARLSPSESAALAHRPTRNADAYNAYLKAEYYGRAPWTSTSGYARLFAQADRAFAEAVRLDPDFALAYARWAEVELVHHLFLSNHWMPGHAEPALLDQARAHIEMALRLAPDLPEAHVSLGRWYIASSGNRSHGKRAKASAQFQRALALDPKQDGARKGLAQIAAAEGHMHEALALLKPALERDPRDVLLLRQLSSVYEALGEYGQMIRLYKQAVAIDPTDKIDRLFLAQSIRFGEGDLDKARAVVQALGDSTEERWDYFRISELMTVLLWQRDAKAATHLLDKTPQGVFKGAWQRPYYRGRIASLQHRDEQARRDFAQAATDVKADIKRHPDQVNLEYVLAELMARQGQSDAALALTKRLLAKLPKNAFPFQIARARCNQAGIHALLGQAGPTLSIMREMRAQNAVYGCFSPWSLRLDPDLDRIRKDPRFHAFIQSMGPVGASSTTASSAPAEADSP